MSTISKEILKKVRRIQIQTSWLVTDILAGEYHSTFKGMGMEFSEVREYVPGDDIRTIDWNVTARMNKPFVKQFVEERELNVILMVDVSASGSYSSARQTRTEIAAELSSVLALSAIQNNDKVGVLLFSDEVEKFIPPKKGKSHVLRVIREVLSFESRGAGTNINEALEYLNKTIRRKAVVFLISDFLDEGFERSLRIARRRHDLVCIDLKDPRDRELPDIGLVQLEDAETGEICLVDSSDADTRKALSLLADRQEREKDHFFKTYQVPRISVLTNESWVNPLMQFFRSR